MDEPVSYDVSMDDDDDDVDEDDASTGADVYNGTARNDVTTTDDVDERHQRLSLTSSPPGDVDFAASSPSPRRPNLAAKSSCSPCSSTASPQPTSPPPSRAVSLAITPSASVPAH